MTGGPLLKVFLPAALLAASAASAQDTVALVLVNGAGLPQAVQREVRAAVHQAVAEGGQRVQDLSPLTAGIFEAGMLLPEFDRAPPEGWPESLVSAWEEGNAACREQLGTPGGSPKRRLVLAAAAVECQRILAEALYGRLLRALSPDRVLEITVRPARGGKDAPLRLEGRLFSPGAQGAQGPKGSSAKEAEQEVPSDALGKGAVALAKTLLEGGGKQGAVPLERALPVRPAPKLAVLESQTTRARLEEVRIHDDCQSQLPARLALSPGPDESQFAQSLLRRWERSVTRGPPGKTPATCALRGYPTRMNVAGKTADAVEVILTCEGKELRASAPVDEALRRRHEPLHDVLTGELVRQLAAALCD